MRGWSGLQSALPPRLQWGEPWLSLSLFMAAEQESQAMRWEASVREIAQSLRKKAHITF